MNIISWMMIGSLIGVITNFVAPQPNRGGIVGATLLGTIGAILGGFTANRLIYTSLFTFEIQSFGFAIIGALCLLTIGKIFSTDIRRFQKFER